VDEVVAAVTAAVLPDAAAAACNREVLHADTVTPDALVSAGLALPLFGGGQLVLLRGLGGVPAKTVDRFRDALDAARAQPGGWPAPGVTVLLLASGVDRKSPVLRLAPEGEQVEVRSPTGRAVGGWLQERARAAGLQLAPGAAEALLTLVGEDLGRLAGELEKAAVFAGPDGRVDDEVVRALVGESRVRRYWELTQALEEGEGGRALRVLQQLFDAGEEPTVLLSLITGHFRDLAKAKAGLADGKNARAMVGDFRGRPTFVVERLVGRAKNVPAATVEDGLRACFDVELRLKSSGGEAAALLTALVLERVRA
jgi:DNA polymerase-3 subunit delta